jgi:hypothetical protein
MSAANGTEGGRSAVLLVLSPERRIAPMRLLLILSLFFLATAMPVAAAEPSPIARPGTGTATCTVANGTDLAHCMQNIRAYRRLVFTGDVECTTAETCCPNGQAPITFNANGNLTLDGNGHHILRHAGQAMCPALSVTRAHDITVQNLTFDEDRTTPPCELKDKTCASAIFVFISKNVLMSHVSVSYGKGYVIKIWRTNGFTFENSTISDAGIIGLYVGQFKYAPSTDIIIRDSSFIRSRTNGVALDGAYPSSPQAHNIVENNVFIDNHWHGLWPAGHIPGGITSGGQLLVANGRDITVSGNKFFGHPCGNCRPKNAISAIEIGDANPPPAGVEKLTVDCNVFTVSGQQGNAIRYDTKTIFSAASFTRNSLFGYTDLDDVPADLKPRMLTREMPPSHLDRLPEANAPISCQRENIVWRKK